MGRRELFLKAGAGGLRLLTLASRFVFVFAAAFFLTPEDFGIYGLIAAGSYVVVQLAGIEAHAVVLRRIARTEAGSAGDERGFYGRFVILSTFVAFAMGAGAGHAFGWEMPVVGLAGSVMALEYAGVEAARILAAERRAHLALVSTSIRHVPWALGLPALGLTGTLPGPWMLEMVLAAWALSALAALGLILPVLGRYLSRLPGRYRPWHTRLLATAPRWMLIALAPRFIESGVRLVPGVVIDEVAAGRFVFLATLAGIGMIAVRAVVEPFHFAAMLAEGPGGHEARRRFGWATGLTLAASAPVSALGWWAATAWGGRDLGPSSAAALALLLVAGAAASLAQVAHYRLYAVHRDRAILRASLATLALGVPLALGLTHAWDTLGTALAAALAALLLLGFKAWEARAGTAARARLAGR